MILFDTSQRSRTVRKIMSFKTLPSGWHYGRGSAINNEVVVTAYGLHDSMLLSGLTRTDAFAGESGEILLTGYFRDHYISLMVEGRDKIDVGHEEGGQIVNEADGLAIAEASAWIARTMRGIWSSSGWFTHATMITIEDALMTSSSRNLPMAGGCLSSSVHVERPLAVA